MSRKHSITDCIAFAATKGGKCLSPNYADNKKKIEWECLCGFGWSACFNSILLGHWCPKCSGHARLTMDDCRSLAIARGGFCLSTECINSQTKMTWKCKKGHV
jgi:hypothetical protein